MGKKEQILELIKENDGLTYTTLIRKYNEKYDKPDTPDTLKEKSGYSYLKRLRKAGLIENDKGINTLYKPTPKAYLTIEERNKPNTDLTDKVIEVLVKSGTNSDDYGVEISEKEIMPSIKRLTESGKLG